MRVNARRYAGVALRATWAAVLSKLRLRTLAGAAYDEALVRAAALAEEFAPAEPVNVWSSPLVVTQGTATTTVGQYGLGDFFTLRKVN